MKQIIENILGVKIKKIPDSKAKIDDGRALAIKHGIEREFLIALDAGYTVEEALAAWDIEYEEM